jgi:DNA processing protein
MVAAMTERDAWLALASASGVGETIFWGLVAAHGGAAEALRAVASGWKPRDDELRITRPTRAAIVSAFREPGTVARRVNELGLWTVTPLDTGFPVRLRDIDPPPATIFGWGDLAGLSAQRTVAVVGTRRPTLDGRTLAARIAMRLVAADAVVVSGLAIGIDGAAHAATVGAGGRTVAVIGGGHAHPGPRAHRALSRDIVEGGGAIVSEHAPDTLPTRGTFPRRNRIISALGDTTIVVEAPGRSGALITARHALEQGRSVLAVPGRPGDPSVAGCLSLLRDTPARPLTGLDEMIVDLGYDTVVHASAAGGRLSLAAALALLGPVERAVAVRLARGPANADALITETGLAPPVVSGAITLLLLRGWIAAVGPAYLPAGPLLAADLR